MTAAELVETAVALRPVLLQRALELCGGHHADAEDLVGEAYLAFCRKPPEPRSPAQLKHWLRTVLARRRVDAFRRRFGAEGEVRVESLDSVLGWRG